ncbi:hypothetical protein [Corynebacterium confusum]|uniref:hypothetical protein n=1 Tax=Corynebacterium confusum TaxID=71254 RepID=UPI0025B34ACB|nr:hypothetical protein [Corynebacterium confusum]WJY88661.1 hypothetical protein CCONF_00445 [Corynebacterium confusum]
MKKRLAALVLTATLATPAVASADPVDDLLAKVPAGQISCEKARSYWTNPGDYQSKRSQALSVATFHPRGGEIRSAIARMDDAVNRCNLGQSGNQQQQQNRAPQTNQQNRAPQNNNRPQNVIDLAVIPGQPTVDLPFAGQTFRLPDFVAMARTALAQVQSQFAQLSSL